MKRTIYNVFTATVIAMGATACSDNYNTEFEPLGTVVRTLSVDVESSNFSNGKLSLGAAPSSTVVKVMSNTRWAAEVTDCDGGWCDIDVYNGSSDGTFTISVRENMRELRTCYVRVYKVNAAGEKDTSDSQDITVSQVASDVRLSPSSLEPFPADSPRSQEFEIVSNVAWTLSVSYESGSVTDFVTITPLSGTMEERPEGGFSGTGDARFNMSLQSNRTAADRKAFITLSSEVATYTVEISQNKSNFTFDVSPSEGQLVSPEGGTINFGVLSLSDWIVSTAVDWVVFSPSSGTASDQRVSTVATVLPNPTDTVRTAQILFKPTDGNYQQQAVTIKQQPFAFTFSISPSGSMGVVAEAGEQHTLSIDSRFDWDLELPDWITASRISGTGSASEQSVTLTVAPNNNQSNRTGNVKVIPKPTLFGGVITISPSSVGIREDGVFITQFGGREPAVSVPWLLDDYTQTSATVQFNYYSPFFDVVEAGLEWRREDASEWIRENVTVTDHTEGIVSVTLTGLDAATKYVARGYVVDSNGTRKYGNVSYPFTTAGQRPNEDDNPTP